MLLKQFTVSTTVLAVIGSAVVVAAGQAGADPNVPGTYNSTGGVRVVDTRTGTGLPKARLGHNQTVTFSVAKQLNAAGALAPLNLGITAVSPTANGYLTFFRGDTTRPATSTLNYQTGRTTTNSTVVQAGATSTVSVYNGSAGTVDLVVDLNGYWTAGAEDSSTAGSLHAVTPQRLVDSRTATAVPGHGTATVPVLGKDGVPADDVSAVLVNITALGGSTYGFLSASGDPENSDARTSIVNFTAGQVRAGLAPVQPNTDGAMTIYNGSSSPTNYTVDVLAYVTDGAPDGDGAFLAGTAERVQDTRTGSPVAAYGTDKLPLFPDNTFKAVAVTVTVVDAKATGYLSAYSGSGSIPPTSSANHLTGEVVAQTLLVPVNQDGSISIVNRSGGTLDLLVDVRGYVLNADPGTGNTASRIKAAITHERRYAAQHVAR